MNGDMFPEVVPAEDPNRRYTTRAFMHFIKRVAGVEAWDLDPAADMESHHAPRWFRSPSDPERDGDLYAMAGCCGVDGLASSWLPDLEFIDRPPAWRVFVNPPFDNIGPWLAKVWATIEQARGLAFEVRIAFVMPGNRHEQPFWHEHVEPFRDGRATRFGYRLELHFPPGRQAYAKPGSNGVAVGSADFPSALLVWRRA